VSRPSLEVGLAPLHVVLPLRTLSGGKARLGGAVDAEERETLILGMARRTVAVLLAWPDCDRIHVVSPDRALLAAVASDGQAESDPERLSTLVQDGEGLGAAIVAGRERALGSGATSLLVLPGDLPELSSDSLDRLVLAADAGLAAARGAPLVTIAPAEARGGTNALLLRPPDAIDPAFGEASFEAHLRAAASSGAAVQVVRDEALGFDLDTPDDLERLDPDRFRELMRLGQEREEAVGG
jgi:2-phospho-L-lactate/phosphoenolpyruvate guanylyltransferase